MPGSDILSPLPDVIAVSKSKQRTQFTVIDRTACDKACHNCSPLSTTSLLDPYLIRISGEKKEVRYLLRQFT